jgi:hypothetical protein
MTFLAVTLALVAALALGYVLGRRSVSRTPTWSQRTSRAALGRQTLSLLALVAASQLQRSVGQRMPIASVRRLSRHILR